LHLGGEPVFEAGVVDQTDTPGTVAGHDARVLLTGLIAPAEPALLDFMGGWIHNSDRLCFFEFLVVEFLGGLLHLLAGEVLDSELDPPKFYDIKLLDFVVLN